MKKNFFIKDSNSNIYTNAREKNFSLVQDSIVDNFVNKNISLETIIENEMFKEFIEINREFNSDKKY